MLTEKPDAPTPETTAEDVSASPLAAARFAERLVFQWQSLSASPEVLFNGGALREAIAKALVEVGEIVRAAERKAAREGLGILAEKNRELREVLEAVRKSAEDWSCVACGVPQSGDARAREIPHETHCIIAEVLDLPREKGKR